MIARNRNHGFDVKVLWDDGGDDLREIRIVGEISPYYPAVMYMSNGDPGHPAEGAEIENYKIFDTATGNGIEDPGGDILDSVLDEVYEKISEGAASDQADAAEHRADAMRDR